MLLAQELWRGEVKQLSWSPRSFLLKGFLSDKECEYMINKGGGQSSCSATTATADLLTLEHLQAKPMMTKSTVVDNETGKSVDSTVRTSTGTFFSREQDQTIAAIEKRISMVCNARMSMQTLQTLCTFRLKLHGHALA